MRVFGADISIDGAREMLAVSPRAVRLPEDAHRPDDRFIPVRAAALAAEIVTDPAFAPTACETRAIAEAFSLAIEQESAGFARELDALFAQFNPHRDTDPRAEAGPGRTPEAERRLFAFLSYLLDKANYEQLSDVQIEAAINAANTHGMRIRVDPDRVERLELFVRGHAFIERQVRTWRSPLRDVTQQVEVYRRLAVLVRMKDEQTVSLKLFREIPAADLEALLPHATVHMNWFDRIKVFAGGAGALGGLASKLIAGAAMSLALFWTLTVALFGLAFRAFMGYRRTKSQRDAQRTHNLYFQSLANNAAAVHTLIRVVAEEEEKEAMLAYAFLAWGGCDDATLDGTIERWLRDRLGVDVNFDCADALETLGRLGLRTAAGGVVSIDDALAALERARLDPASRRYHREQAERRRTGHASGV
ncbi:MAG: DUF3754 domain-containing protein [Planctomycetota bacterium]